VRDGRFQLRRYPAIAVVTTPLDGMAARNQSFRKLFRYISGDNAAGQKIAMTAPVFMDEAPGDAPDGAHGAMSFVLPAAVATAGPPAPAADAVKLATLPAGKVAVIEFKGWTSAEARERAVAELRDWVARNGWSAAGDPFFAFYDPPWKPEFLRRNEVHLRIR
jgi:DNA gyrase inhibitor GyrI